MPHAPRHARLVVVGAEDHPPHFGEHNRPGALGARLERDIEGVVAEAIGVERASARRIARNSACAVGLFWATVSL